MKLRFTLLLSLMFLFTLSQAQSNLAIDFGTKKNATEVKESSFDKLSVSYTFDGIKNFNVTSEKGTFSEISIPNLHSIGAIGTPKLPAAKDLIEIPFGADVKVVVKSYTVNEYNLTDFGLQNKIMPVQPSISKDQDPAAVEFIFDEKAYTSNKFIKHELVTVEVLGTLRGMRLARLVVAPVEYNPVNNVIKVYNDIDADIVFENADVKLTEEIKRATFSPYFIPVYRAVMNPMVDHDYPDHPDLTTYPVKYVIVSDRMFEETLQPFIEWKRLKGFNVIELYTDVIGSSVNDIQTELENLYNAGTEEDPAPSFVLFVGDTPQVPASATGSSSGKKTDLYYCSIDGDYFPEMYYGRFSATSPSMLENIIEKSLYYEKYEFADPAYLDRVTLIAGADGTWNPRVGQPTVQYGTENYFNAAHGYTDVNDYLTSYSGCYATVDDGVGFINYTAHCSETSWGTPSLSISDVNSFTNTNMYPLAVGNCCLAADFGYGECIGEAWLRAEDKGAVAYIGSSPSSYWFEDFYWAVGAFPIQGTNDGYIPTYEETTWGAYDAPFMSDYVSVDAMIFIGNLAVTEVHVQGYPSHSSPTYYWQAYNCLGDPSLVIYHTQGEINEVSYMDVLPIGVDEFEVTAEPGSYVAISFNGELKGTAIVDESGVVTVPIIPIEDAGMADIVVTKPQYQPFVEQIMAAPLDGPYVTVDYVEVDDAEGNDNAAADFGESVSLDVSLKNVGTENAENVTVTISTEDEYVSLTDNTEEWGAIEADGNSFITGAFGITVADFIPDGHMASFGVNSTDGVNDPWTSSFSILLNAPVLSLTDFSIDDSEAGNGNNQLDPGEIVKIYIKALNEGHAATNLANVDLAVESDFAIVESLPVEFNSVEAESSEIAYFYVSIDADATIGSYATFTFSFSSDDYMAEEFAVTKKIGLVVEDFETGDFTAFNWTFGGNADWIISTDAQEGVYSAQSGDINDSQTSTLSVTLEVAETDVVSFYKKVSSEGNYDYLRFYIDNSEMGEWAGTVDWSYEEFDVTAGTHTFKWAFEKDGSVTSGSDCGWIDYIVLPSSGGTVTNNAPVVTTDPVLIATTNVMYEYEITATDEDGDNIIIEAMDVPEWITVDDHGDGTAMISGMPTSEDIGDHQVMVMVSDGMAYCSHFYTVSVQEVNVAPEFVSTAVTNAYVDSAYMYEIEVYDENGHDLTIDATQLPEWLTLTVIDNTHAELTGTPVEAGSYDVTLTVTDGIEVAQQSFTITVSASSINQLNQFDGFSYSLYPNPFSDKTNISYTLEKETEISVALYDLGGRMVEAVINDQIQNAGNYMIEINASEIEPGIYYCKFNINSYSFSQKIIITQ